MTEAVAKRIATEAAFRTGNDHMVWRFPGWKSPAGEPLYTVDPVSRIMKLADNVEVKFIAKAPTTGNLFD